MTERALAKNDEGVFKRWGRGMKGRMDGVKDKYVMFTFFYPPVFLPGFTGALTAQLERVFCDVVLLMLIAVCLGCIRIKLVISRRRISLPLRHRRRGLLRTSEVVVSIVRDDV